MKFNLNRTLFLIFMSVLGICANGQNAWQNSTSFSSELSSSRDLVYEKAKINLNDELSDFGHENHFHDNTGKPQQIPLGCGVCYPGTGNRFTGSYHSDLYIGNNCGANVLYGWGQNMQGYLGGSAGNLTVPTLVPQSSYGSGVAMEVKSSSSGGANGYSALVLRTTLNLYVFGTAANLSAITTMTGWGGTSITAAASDVTSKLPSGITIDSISSVEISQTAFAIITKGGRVFMLTKVTNLQGDQAASGPAIWHTVKLSGGSTQLTGVKKLSLSSSGAFALTTSGKIFYWGSPANVAGAVNTTTSYNYAYDMSAQIPSGKIVKDLVCLGTTTPSPSTLFILCDDTQVYACGLNTNGCLGINNSTYTTNQATFQPVKGTDGVTNLTNVIKIDGDTEADIFCMAALTADGKVFGWGDSPAAMLGLPLTGAAVGSYPVPKTVQLFADSPSPILGYTDFSVGGHFIIAFYSTPTADQYWYLGHNTGGSIGDGTPTPNPTFIVETASVYLNAPAGFAFDCSTALPINLTSFNGNWNNDDQVVLSWKTSSELNTSFYEVERSTDGINFNSIGRKPAAGNSTNEIFYSFKDVTPTRGLNFYRLKTFELDGKSTYSRILRMSQHQKDFFYCDPNPFNSYINIQVSSPVKQTAIIKLINANGQTIYNNSKPLLAGSNSVQISNLSNLVEGIYLLEINLENKKLTQKVIKIK